MKTVCSPLSQQPPEKIRDLPAQFLRAQLGAYFQAAPPDELVETDYALWRCTETGLEFSWPLLPGNAQFYKWVSSFESYYPHARWEYAEVQRLLGPDLVSLSTFKVLDVGCGQGDFLRSFASVPADRKYALDLNEPAIQACRAQGFRACCGTLASAVAAGFVAPHEFPVVTAFHCLEHVGDPVAFVRELLGVTQPGGRVFLSTPYSPMAVEDNWFDVLNHPPHHMTRWNLNAYRKLADILGVTLRYFAPAPGIGGQARLAFRVKRFGPTVKLDKMQMLCAIAKNAPQYLAVWWRLYRRSRQHVLGGADSILIEFTVPG